MTASIRITCLVNNEIAFDTPLWGEHGLAFLIETGGKTILFDSGQTAQVLAHNLDKLGCSLQGVSEIVLSHGHYDHTGGLDWALDQTNHPRVVGCDAMFERKLSLRYTPPREIGSPLRAEQIAARAELVLSDAPYRLAPGVGVSGVIRAEESSDPYLVLEEGGKLVPDPIVDDRAIWLETSRGVVVVLGCCHAGLISTLRHIRNMSGKPVIAVLGGSHLKPADDAKVERVIAQLKQEFPEVETYRLNHCTGSRALAAFRAAFGEKAQPFLAGEVLEFA